MSNLTQIELDSLRDLLKISDPAQRRTGYSQILDGIKNARSGDYPPDWWEKVKLSGLMDQILGEAAEIKIQGFRNMDDLLRDLRPKS